MPSAGGQFEIPGRADRAWAVHWGRHTIGTVVVSAGRSSGFDIRRTDANAKRSPGGHLSGSASAPTFRVLFNQIWYHPLGLRVWVILFGLQLCQGIIDVDLTLLQSFQYAKACVAAFRERGGVVSRMKLLRLGCLGTILLG